MIFIANRRFQKNKIVAISDTDSECLTTYSKRAAEFNEEDFEEYLSETYLDVAAKDNFGIVLLVHGAYEFLIEKTNLGFSIRGFFGNRPDYSLDKMGYDFKLADLLV